MISDYLKAKGWEVEHIMAIDKEEPHSYTAPARIIGDKVVYYDEGTLLDLQWLIYPATNHPLHNRSISYHEGLPLDDDSL